MKKWFFLSFFIILNCAFFAKVLFSQSGSGNLTAEEVLKELRGINSAKEVEKENVERKYGGKAPETYGVGEEMEESKKESKSKSKKPEVFYSLPEKASAPEFAVFFGESLKEEKRTKEEKEVKAEGESRTESLKEKETAAQSLLKSWTGKYYCSVDEDVEVSIQPVVRPFKCLRYKSEKEKELVKNVMIRLEPSIPYLTSTDVGQVPYLKGRVVEIGGKSLKENEAVPVYSFNYKTGEIKEDVADEVDERLIRYILSSSLASAGSKTAESVSQIFQNSAPQSTYYYVEGENRGEYVKESLKQIPQAGLYYFLAGVAESSGKAMSKSYKLAPVFKVKKGKVLYFKIEE